MVIAKMESTESLRETSDPLLVLNERAAQIKANVQWVSFSHGPSHLPSWTVKCVCKSSFLYWVQRVLMPLFTVNNIQKGVGRGTSKQSAKRVAAHEALSGMGWIGGAHLGVPVVWYLRLTTAFRRIIVCFSTWARPRSVAKRSRQHRRGQEAPTRLAHTKGRT